MEDTTSDNFTRNQRSIVQMFSLARVRVLVGNHQIAQQFLLDSEKPSEELKARPNLVRVSFKLVLSKGLNQCLKPRASILSIWIKSLRIDVQLHTQEGAYCFEQMNYFLFLEARSNHHGDACLIDVKNVQYSLRRTEIEVDVIIARDGNAIEEAEFLNFVAVQAGSSSLAQFLPFQLSSLDISTQHSTKRLNQYKSTCENKFKFIDKEYSLPLKVFSQVTQIYESLGFSGYSTLQQIEALIAGLPSYQSPQREAENKLFLCHDMKGGYKQDLFFDHNIVPSRNPQNIAYRALQLEQAEIFNYFSHHNITVPPRHWRMTCKRYGAQCLGTFITERADYSENMLTAKQFALFLVAIAKKCRFDGYLINIERKINSYSAFKKWVQYFTFKMHEFIPNSTIIWYDSISGKDGEVRYQNSLSRQNYQFYHFSDGLFTNYWWNEGLLKQSVDLRRDNSRKVYIGNDCFGRNTYGGGKLDIYKATNVILYFKQQLSIALFAPAFTYENGGEQNRTLFHLQQNGLYKGVNTKTVPLDQWRYKNGRGWQKQGDQVVSGFERYGQCERSLTLKFQPLADGQQIRVMFMCQVQSTPPLFGSPYKIIMQIVDPDNKVIIETDTYNFFDCKQSQEQFESVSKEITASYASIGSRDLSVRVIIMAQAKQNWAGFFGARFKNQMVVVSTYEKERHWTSKIPINQVVVGSLFHSYCNIGFGDNFFKQGLKLQKDYNFLADMDVPHTHIINNPLDLDFSYDEAFFGGSSLAIKKQSIKLLKLVIPKGTDLKEEYYLQVTVKNTLGINAVCKYISKNQEDRIFTTKLFYTEDINGWKRFTFRLVTTLNQVNANVRSIVELTSIKWPYYLGQIKLIKGNKQVYNPFNCLLQASKERIPTDKYYLDLTIRSTVYQRLYVQIEQVGLFAYFQDGVALLKNLPIPKCESFEVEIVDVDECLKPVTLCLKKFGAAQIQQLVFKGSLQF